MTARERAEKAIDSLTLHQFSGLAYDEMVESFAAAITAAERDAMQAERARCERIADVFAKAIGEGECAATMRKVGLEIWNHIHGGEAWPPPPGASASESTIGG
jgi:hypothetical protein